MNFLKLSLTSALIISLTSTTIFCGRANDVSSVAQFDSHIKNERVIVDFYAPWCGPCRTLAPRIEKVASKHSQVTVLKVNIDEVPGVANRYNVQSLPTIMLFKNGKQVYKVIGCKTEAELDNLIKVYLS